MRQRIIVFTSVVLLLLIAVATTSGQEEEPITVFLPHVANNAATEPTSTSEPPPTATDTPTATATATATSASTPEPTMTPIPTLTQLYLRWEIADGDFVHYLDTEPHQLDIIFATSLFPSAVDTYSFPLNGDISGNSYDFSLVLGISSGPGVPPASSIAFHVELLVNDQVLASTNFTATSTNHERFSATITGIDPTSGPGDTLTLRITNVSETGAGDVFVGKSPDYDSNIWVPISTQDPDDPDPTPMPTLTDTPIPAPTDTPIPAPTDTPTPEPTDEPSCTLRTGEWSGETSQNSSAVSFEVTSDCMVRAFRIEIPSAIPVTICVVTINEDLSIIDNQFSFKTSGLARFELTGEFVNDSDASGSYDTGPLFSCGPPVAAPGEGTWEAQPD